MDAPEQANSLDQPLSTVNVVPSDPSNEATSLGLSPHSLPATHVKGRGAERASLHVGRTADHLDAGVENDASQENVFTNGAVHLEAAGPSAADRSGTGRAVPRAAVRGERDRAEDAEEQMTDIERERRDRINRINNEMGGAYLIMLKQ